jgi:AcrR family transcriptional regulator
MTEKQEKILEAALLLFAENGYNATSTSKVALNAGVSEGLIFRHFKSKEGLLDALMEMGNKRVMAMFEKINWKDDPKIILRRIIEIPFNIGPDEFHFWRLFYMIKWQTYEYSDSMYEKITKILVEVFKKLNYNNPKSEAEVVQMLIDGVATNRLLRRPENPRALLKSILAKYGL